MLYIYVIYIYIHIQDQNSNSAIIYSFFLISFFKKKYYRISTSRVYVGEHSEVCSCGVPRHGTNDVSAHLVYIHVYILYIYLCIHMARIIFPPTLCIYNIYIYIYIYVVYIIYIYTCINICIYVWHGTNDISAHLTYILYICL